LTVLVQVSTSFRPRIAASFALTTRPTPQVPLSAGSVRIDSDSYGINNGPNIAGTDPSPDLK
jgi:hypothetical protein